MDSILKLSTMKSCTSIKQTALVSQVITGYSRVSAYLWVTGEIGVLAVR